MAKPEPFGYLLTLDLYNCAPGACDDIGLCYRYLDEVVGVIGTHKQSPPFIFKSDGDKYPDKAGLSGWVPLIESGIQMHTLTPKNFISIDVYSCRKFDPKEITDFTRKFFSAGEIESQFIERGLKYNQ